jgi:hypothetical protein
MGSGEADAVAPPFPRPKKNNLKCGARPPIL